MSEDKGVKIGLETHIQLDTNSKLFCGCSAELSEEPNKHTCDTCLGMPGSKPRTNEKVIEYALRASLALECEIKDEVRFSRKTYFYPDMSKNFQITQHEIPVGVEGELKTKLGDEKKNIRIKRLHIEEDPAKINHKGGDITSSDYTLLDYNRAGIPLIEIVTKPDFSAPEEARKFLQKLTKIMEYLGIYDPSSDLSIKSDANISIEGGERVEVKNITGTKGIEKALNYEITRQKNLKKRGRDIKRETRSYNSAQEITNSMRQKESEAGYGYILEPDLTKLDIEREEVESIEKELPELPDEKLERFVRDYELPEEIAESLITEKELAEDFEELVVDHDSSITANWMTKELKKTLNYNGISYRESGLEKDWISYIIGLLEEDKITDRNAEKVIRETVEKSVDPEKIVEREDLLKAESSEIETTVTEVIEANQNAVEDYRSGEEGAINYLVGQVMKRSNGKADPRETRELIEKELENSQD